MLISINNYFYDTSDKKIIHHDVKPANLLVKVNGEVMKIKLCDFEMAISNEQKHDKICRSLCIF